VRRKIAFTLATWFGCGYVPFAPGTAGTLGAVPLYLLLRPYGPVVILVVAALLTAIGIWASSVVIEHTRLKDPQIVVIDEVAGVLVTLAASPPTWAGLIAGVVAFRVFDQTKPWPARWAERQLPGGYGVVLDDIAAGAWGAFLMVVLTRAHVI
jgi:phosphatidylglycerophosphatase A